MLVFIYFTFDNITKRYVRLGMISTALRTRADYEIIYDKGTIDSCRRGERLVNNTFTELDRKLPDSEKKEHQAGWYLFYSQLYFKFVETVAAERAHDREKTIAGWIEADEQQGQRLAAASMKPPYMLFIQQAYKRAIQELCALRLYTREEVCQHEI